jgi:hypothetical protein
MMDDKKHPLAPQLRNLGKMRKSKGNDAFKNMLRAKINERAEELETKPKRSWNFDWRRALTKRFIPAVSLALVAVIMVQVLVGPGSYLNLPIELVNVAEAQEYYTLTPSYEDDGGIDSESSFTLSSKGELDAAEIAEVLTLSPEITFSLEQVDSYTLSLLPDFPLESGELYQFELAAQNLDDAPYKKTFRWAYTVSDSFRVTGTHPGNESTGAPINTGIEISVTHLGLDDKDIKKNFSITPEVNGDFSVADKTITFVPNEDLLENTIYTVTLNADLPLSETDQTLGEDYVWQFETDDEPITDLSLSIERFLTIAPDDASLMQAHAYDRSAEKDAATLVDVDIYKYSDGDEFMEAIDEYRDFVPSWTHYADEQYKASSSGLSHVLSSTDLPLTEQNYRDFIQLPNALEEGQYLMNVQFGSEFEQSFVQVSNTATYMAVSPEETVVWVNDLITGEAVEGAEINILDSSLSAKTNSEGLAVFEDIYEELGFGEFGDKNIQISVESDRDITFYDKDFYNYDNNYNVAAWGLFETDRTTYKPNDTMRFWGMIQGRESALNGDAKLYVTHSSFDYGIAVSELENFDHLVDVIDLEIKDGDLFEGQLELVQYSENYHNVYLVMDDEIIMRDQFWVQNFELPAYEIVLSTEQDAYLAGDEIEISIEARFFDGTPVANTEFRVNDPDENDLYVTTDADGLATASWTSDARFEKCSDYRYCYISYSDSFGVFPVQEELANISELVRFDVFRSQVSLDESDRLDHEAWEFVTYEVDVEETFENLNFFSYYEDRHVSDVVATKGSVDYLVERQDVIITTTDYYDEVDKVTKQKTSSKTEYNQVLSGSISPDESGLYHLDLNLDDTETYRIYATINDGLGGYYQDSFWMQSAYDNGISEYLNIDTVDEPKAGYSIGDTVKVEGIMNDATIVSDEDNFLFLQARNGILETQIQEDGLYEFEYDSNDVPNIYVTAVRFNGTAYQTTFSQNIQLDINDREFDVSASTDKDEYAPGDEITLSIDAEQESNVQIQLVDEAYYSLYDEDLYDPLMEIYSSISSNIAAVSVSHEAEEMDIGKGGCFVPGTEILMADGTTKYIEDIEVGDYVLTRENEFSDTLVAAEVSALHSEAVVETILVNGELGLTDNHIIFINGQWKEASKLQIGDVLLADNGEWISVDSIDTKIEPMRVYNFEVTDLHTYFADGHYVHNDKGGDVRSDFPLTAYFDVVETDANGQASITFTLPDSITEWRVSVSAVTPGKEIMAGSTSAAVVVSKDAFVVPVLNTTYLEGDQPMLPIRAYGDALSMGMTTNFWLESESIGLGMNSDGTAFETSYFELDPLTEGTHDFTFGLESDAGDDAIYLETEVVESYFRLPQMIETELTDGVNIPGSETSQTEVSFLNLENSEIYWSLRFALSQDGNRADEALGRNLAALWLNEEFDMDKGVIEFDPGVYQNVGGGSEGGVSLFPYSDADLELTAEMAALAPESWNSSAMREYFEDVLYDDERTLTEKMQSIYGLAGIGQNMILELTVFEREFELSNEDKLWAALAYSEMGAGDQVTSLYLELAEEDWNANQLMLLATLADYVSSDQRNELYESAKESDDFILLTSLIYTKQRLTHVSGDPVSFKINGEKIELEAGHVITRTFNSNEFDAIEISNVDGAILAVSNFWDMEDPEGVVTSDDISIERWYEVDGKKVDTLNSGDVVEVHFKLELEFKNSYRVVDYLPSGLQPLTRSYSSWSKDWNTGYRSPYQTNNQELSFNIYCREYCSSQEFYYIARVVNPGSFKAEPALLQQFSELDITTISEEVNVVIQP